MMKLPLKILALLFLTACVTISCKDDDDNSPKENFELLLGHWNDYENGTQQTGFTPGITTSLTLLYESGIAFSSDGTFRPRYHFNDTWTESEIATGTYELNGKTLSLVFSPGTPDDHKLDIELIKLDEKHLWIKHSFFAEQEFHLEKVSN